MVLKITYNNDKPVRSGPIRVASPELVRMLQRDATDIEVADHLEKNEGWKLLTVVANGAERELWFRKD